MKSKMKWKATHYINLFIVIVFVVMLLAGTMGSKEPFANTTVNADDTIIKSNYEKDGNTGITNVNFNLEIPPFQYPNIPTTLPITPTSTASATPTPTVTTIRPTTTATATATADAASRSTTVPTSSSITINPISSITIGPIMTPTIGPIMTPTIGPIMTPTIGPIMTPTLKK